eukprot:275529_1
MLEKKQPTLSEKTQQPTDNENISLTTKISKHIGGIICLIILVINWVTYAEIMQTFKSGSYNHLYFIRYCCVSGYMFAIIPWFFIHRHSIKQLKYAKLKKQLHQNVIFNPNDSMSIGPALEYSTLPDNSVSVNKRINNTNTAGTIEQDYEHVHTFQFMKSMTRGIICVGMATFFCGYIWYMSLDHTFVAANNTIYQSQCVFVLIFSAFILNTKITLMKMIAMLLAVGGVAMVSFGTTKESDNDIQTKWYGYVECITSTILYATQGITTKYFGDKYFRHNLEIADDFLLMVGIGIFVFIFFWPGLIILHMTGIETFSLPKTTQDILTVILPMLLDAIFVASYMTGITLSGPILMSLGSLTIIPVSFIVDVWLHGLEITIFAVIGSLLIFVSFIVIEIPTHKLVCCIERKNQTT